MTTRFVINLLTINNGIIMVYRWFSAPYSLTFLANYLNALIAISKGINA